MKKSAETRIIPPMPIVDLLSDSSGESDLDDCDILSALKREHLDSPIRKGEQSTEDHLSKQDQGLSRNIPDLYNVDLPDIVPAAQHG